MRKPLDRRTVLRGLGTSLALPFIEAMLPTRARAADLARPQRLQVFYTPNGMMMDYFVPKQAGFDYELSPTLQPLANFRNDFAVLTGLAHYNANSFGQGGGAHGRACGAYLTAVHPKPTEGSDLECGISMDQIVAMKFAEDTQLASLELGIDPPTLLGSCDVGYSCTYTNTLSWRTPTSALPVAVNPSEVFARLFGDGDALDEASRLHELKRKASILDFVRNDAARLSKNLGMNDRRKLDEYLEAIRDVERRIQKASTQSIDLDLSTVERPAGIPDDFQEHAKLMIDLQVLALQTDMTRVITFMLGRELSNRAYPEIGVADAHHMLSHHGGDESKVVKLARINQFHMQMFAYYLERMRSTPDGEGNLLDNTVVLAGACFGEPNSHDFMDLPAIVAGGGVKGNQHLQLPKETPMANLLLTLMQKLDLPLDQFGDSKGTISGLYA
jgi:Protein of unknown function (DUF1552).